jgi:hypothetical protein
VEAVAEEISGAGKVACSVENQLVRVDTVFVRNVLFGWSIRLVSRVMNENAPNVGHN